MFRQQPGNTIRSCRLAHFSAEETGLSVPGFKTGDAHSVMYRGGRLVVNHFTDVGRKLDHSVGGKIGQRGEKMTEVMRRILPYGSASSHLPTACLPMQWSNFFTIRPRAFQDLQPGTRHSK